MGTSLGALAMLHAHCRYPDAFDALFLQSGSFFCPSLRQLTSGGSPTTGGSSGSWRPRRAGGCASGTIPVVLTCGQIEENVANNRLMTQVLRAERIPGEPA